MGRDHTHVDPNLQVPQKEEQRYERRGEVRTHRADASAVPSPAPAQGLLPHHGPGEDCPEARSGWAEALPCCLLAGVAVPSPDCSFFLKSLWKVHGYSCSNMTSSVLALGTIAGETEPITHASMRPSPASRDV